MLRLLLPVALLAFSTAAAAPYAQQTSFGQPTTLLKSVQTSVPHTWQALPVPQPGPTTSPEVNVAPFNELVPSWNVLGGENRPFTLEVRVRQPDGQWSRYFSFGSWQAATGRRSAPRRPAAGGWVDTDTLKLPYRASAFQFRYQAAANQQMKLLSFNTSDTSLRFQQAGGRPLPLERLLNVPSYSQMIYPDGGEVWCSPTSVSMLLAYWGLRPRVPEVAHATYDETCDGFGNGSVRLSSDRLFCCAC